jgi:hypothetical protein
VHPRCSAPLPSHRSRCALWTQSLRTFSALTADLRHCAQGARGPDPRDPAPGHPPASAPRATRHPSGSGDARGPYYLFIREFSSRFAFDFLRYFCGSFPFSPARGGVVLRCVRGCMEHAVHSYHVPRSCAPRHLARSTLHLCASCATDGALAPPAGPGALPAYFRPVSTHRTRLAGPSRDGPSAGRWPCRWPTASLTQTRLVYSVVGACRECRAHATLVCGQSSSPRKRCSSLLAR